MERLGMKGWEPQLPSTFPIERLHRDAVREGERRRHRRRRRYRGVVSGACAVLLIGTAVLIAARQERGTQVSAGPGPTELPAASPTGEADVSSETAPPTAAATNGKIAFIRRTGPEDPAPKIFVMEEDGSGQTMIAETTRASDLTWSPDGRRLAFQDVGGIYVVDVDGSGERKLPTGSDADQWPSWSPDGTKLAVRGLDGHEGGIYVVNVDGTGRRRLTDGPMDGHPAWSPDGQRIAFSRTVDGGDDIYIMNADGSAQRRLTRLAGFEDAPTWSPDGRKIAFRHNETISVIAVNGGEVQELATPGGVAAANPEGRGANKFASVRGTPATPEWSPDGQKIAFALYQSGEHCTIWIMNGDGSGEVQLTNNRTCDHDPAWQRVPS
jgi:Tol biopolymer transport system component